MPDMSFRFELYYFKPRFEKSLSTLSIFVLSMVALCFIIAICFFALSLNIILNQRTTSNKGVSTGCFATTGYITPSSLRDIKILEITLFTPEPFFSCVLATWFSNQDYFRCKAIGEILKIYENLYKVQVYAYQKSKEK